MGFTLTLFIFSISALVVALAGFYLVRYADILADLTGIGEALFGAILLGAITSLAGIVTSVTAAYQSHPELAMSNAIGGIAAQTLFLSIADIVYRKANLEHSSASYANLLVGLLLIVMLGFILLVIFAPEVAYFGVHPASILLLFVYYLGNRAINKAKESPMWIPRYTSATVEDVPEDNDWEGVNLPLLWAKFIGLAVLVGGAGYAIAQTGVALVRLTDLSEGFVGSLFTSVITSLPELVVTIAAVRQNSLTLAVANIIGGNSFDVLFVSFSDFFYQEGSIFHAIGTEQIFVLILTLLLTAVLLGGLLIRQREGLVKIGWESALIILLFIGGYAILYG